MNEIDLNQLKSRLSHHQYVMVLEFIVSRNFNLEKLDLLKIASQRNIQDEERDISTLDRHFSELLIRTLGRINRMEEHQRTEHQKMVLEKYTVEMVNDILEDFRRCLEDFKTSEEDQIEILEQVRQIFIDIFPEAVTSPRSTRSELETSPTRFVLQKSASSPTLSPRSGGLGGLFKSPRNSYTKSHK